MIGFTITIIISLLMTYIAYTVIKGKIPGGFWVAFLVSVLGSWAGGYFDIFQGVGVTYDKVNILTAIIGSAIFVFLYCAFRKVISQVKI